MLGVGMLDQVHWTRGGKYERRLLLYFNCRRSIVVHGVLIAIFLSRSDGAIEDNLVGRRIIPQNMLFLSGSLLAWYWGVVCKIISGHHQTLLALQHAVITRPSLDTTFRLVYLSSTPSMNVWGLISAREIALKNKQLLITLSICEPRIDSPFSVQPDYKIRYPPSDWIRLIRVTRNQESWTSLKRILDDFCEKDVFKKCHSKPAWKCQLDS